MSNPDTFTNAVLDPSNLPTVGGIEYVTLDPNYRKISVISTSIFTSILLIGAFIGLYYIPMAIIVKTIIAIFLLLFCAFLITVSYYKYKFMGYTLREKDLLYKSGIYFRKAIAIPYNRIQHCELDQGPFERYYNIKKVKIFTAGGSNSDLVLPGLNAEDAESIRSWIIDQTNTKV